jgi:glutaconate CoA-transferase, subunit A
VIPGFLVNAVVECPYGAHPSPVQGCYKRDDSFFENYHQQTKTKADSDRWLQQWVQGTKDRPEYLARLGRERIDDLKVKRHAYAAQTDFGY